MYKVRLSGFWHLVGTSQCNHFFVFPLGGDDIDRQEKLKAKQEIGKVAQGLESIPEDRAGSTFNWRSLTITI